MIKKRTARMISLTTVVVVVAILVGYFAITLGVSAAPALGQAYIEQLPGGQPYFHPNKLSCQRVNGTCTLNIKNTLASSESVTLNGKVVYNLGPHLSTPISFKQAGTYVYGLTNSSHQLTVTIS